MGGDSLPIKNSTQGSYTYEADKVDSAYPSQKSFFNQTHLEKLSSPPSAAKGTLVRGVLGIATGFAAVSAGAALVGLGVPLIAGVALAGGALSGLAELTSQWLSNEDANTQTQTQDFDWKMILESSLYGLIPHYRAKTLLRAALFSMGTGTAVRLGSESFCALSKKEYKFDLAKVFDPTRMAFDVGFGVTGNWKAHRPDVAPHTLNEENILSRIDNGSDIQRGGNSARGVYPLKRTDRVVVKVMNDKAGNYEEAVKLMNGVGKEFKDVNRILKVIKKDGKVYIVQQRARGQQLDTILPRFSANAADKEINNLLLRRVIDFKDRHLIELVQTMNRLGKKGIWVDISNRDNIFYHPSTGFNIIDLQHSGRPSNPITLVDLHCLFSEILLIKPSTLEIDRRYILDGWVDEDILSAFNQKLKNALERAAYNA